MKFNFFLALLFVCSCKAKIEVSGVILDQVTKNPIENALIRTIKDANGSKMEFIETKSKNGRFHFNFLSQLLQTDTIAVEISKNGYLTNMYYFPLNKSIDTVLLVRGN